MSGAGNAPLNDRCRIIAEYHSLDGWPTYTFHGSIRPDCTRQCGAICILWLKVDADCVMKFVDAEELPWQRIGQPHLARLSSKHLTVFRFGTLYRIAKSTCINKTRPDRFTFMSNDQKRGKAATRLIGALFKSNSN